MENYPGKGIGKLAISQAYISCRQFISIKKVK